MTNPILLQLLIIVAIFVCIIPLARNAPDSHSQEDGGFSFNIDNDKDIIDIPQKRSKYENSPDNTIDLRQLGTDLYGEPDYNQTPNRLKEHNADNVNPEELGGYLEGDILVPIQSMYFRNGLPDRSSRWPNGVVPFEVVGITGSALNMLHRAMEEYHKNTCIRFVPRTTQTDYISFVSSSSGCWSGVGRSGGKQVLNLQLPSCMMKVGTAMHEIMHALGFMHEQSREERDAYVDIQFQNMDVKAHKNFKKAEHSVAFGVPYDYGSIMHYSPTAFSSNGRPTILARFPREQTKMGQRDAFSKYDIEKLNKMYECGARGAEFERHPIVATAPPQTHWNDTIIRNAQKNETKSNATVGPSGFSALESVDPISNIVTASGQGTITSSITQQTVTTITNQTTTVITQDPHTGQAIVQQPITTITKQITTTITETNVTRLDGPNTTTILQSSVHHAPPSNQPILFKQSISTGPVVSPVTEVEPSRTFSLASLVPLQEQNDRHSNATQNGQTHSVVAFSAVHKEEENSAANGG